LLCGCEVVLFAWRLYTDFGFAVIKVLRNGRWTEEESAILVPGDIISVKLGDIIPADARLLEGDPLKIDQVMQIEAFLSMWIFLG
jgi:hypothetical protein